MKKIFYLCLVIINFLIIQNNVRVLMAKDNLQFEIIELKEYFDGKAVIVPEECEVILDGIYGKKRFTPNIEEIKKAEKIFKSLVFMLLGNCKECKVKAKEIIKTYYYRQYIGYLNENGQKEIMIVMLKFYDNNTKKYKIWSENWTKRIIIGDSEFSAKLLRYFAVNMSTEKLATTSSPLLDINKL